MSPLKQQHRSMSPCMQLCMPRCTQIAAVHGWMPSVHGQVARECAYKAGTSKQRKHGDTGRLGAHPLPLLAWGVAMPACCHLGCHQSVPSLVAGGREPVGDRAGQGRGG